MIINNYPDLVLYYLRVKEESKSLLLQSGNYIIELQIGKIALGNSN
jgi:hypothetical protein